MRIAKYQVKRTEEYEGGRQKITETRYRILDNEGKVIDGRPGHGYKSAEKARVAHWYKSGNRGKQKTQERTARKWLAKHPGIKRAYLDLVDSNIKQLALGEIIEKESFAVVELQERLGRRDKQSREVPGLFHFSRNVKRSTHTLSPKERYRELHYDNNYDE
jgi:hypothetical protein